MDPTRNAGPLSLAEQRIAWLEARQRVLSQNVAHADTPGFQPRDLRPFAATLEAARRGGGPAPLARTDARHLMPASGGDPRARIDRAAMAERSRNGNAVSLDREALRIAETDTAHSLATGLHRRYLGMFRTALGRP